MNNKKALKISVILGIIILIGLSLGTIGYMYTKASAFDNVFADNVYIEDLAVGGLTREEAKAKLEQDINDTMNQHSIVLAKGEVSKKIPLSDLGITYNINEILDQAFKIGHDKGLFEKYQIAKNGVSSAQYFKLDQSINEAKIEQLLKEYQDSFYVKPVSATLKMVNRHFVTTKEIDGQSMDIEATKAKAVEALSKQDFEAAKTTQIDVVTKAVKAECTEATLEQVQNLASSFSTSFNNANANRNANLEVACKKITTMIETDGIFKLSNYLEPFTEAAGYKNAGVIVNGKVEDGIGGGVCQVASTLYNAVLLTDLEIVMRQNHSLAVSYVPLGRDATYSTDIIDFQFKNNSGYPIFIDAYCANNQVIINIYGCKSLKSPYDIKFASELIETIPAPQTVYEDDPSLEEGKEVTDVRALDGKRVKLYKMYYQNGVEVKRVLVNTSYYKPRAAVIKRGTKKTETQGTVLTPQNKPQVQTPATDNQTNQNSSSKPAGNVQPAKPDNNTSAHAAAAPSPDASQQPADNSGFAVVQQ